MMGYIIFYFDPYVLETGWTENWTNVAFANFLKSFWIADCSFKNLRLKMYWHSSIIWLVLHEDKPFCFKVTVLGCVDCH